MKLLYMDCSCGVSGDMIVGALLDVGADFAALEKALASLGVEGFSVSAEKVLKHGIAATQFRVHQDHHHHHPHRHLKHVLDIIEAGALPEAVQRAAAETFRRIAACEAAIHGTTPEEVHFHEVGAVDSIVDIVGAHWALDSLGVKDVSASALHLGSGTVETAHGVLPVPAPATVALLEGIPAYGSDVQAELVTPTGAALVSQWATRFGPMPLMTCSAIGYGSGTRDLPDRANVLRVLLGETTAAMSDTTPVTVLEANVDDMTPELLAPLVVDFLAAGAHDAFITPTLGKKGRSGHLVTVLCDEARLAGVARVFFLSSTTFGVRLRQERRLCLDRTWETVETPWGEVRIKLGHFEGRVCRRSPEFEDCRAVAERAGVSVLAVYEQALAAAIIGVRDDV